MKYNGKSVEVRDSADYTRIVAEPDSGDNLYNIKEYYQNGTIKLLAKSSTVFPSTLENNAISYFANGKRKAVNHYMRGVYTGKQYYYYPNGVLYQELTYPDVSDPKLDIMNKPYQITSITDSLGTPLVTDGNGYYKGYNDSFSLITEEGPVKSGKKDGEWKGVAERPKLTFKESYTEGVLTKGSSTDEEGKTVEYVGTRAVLPQYKGGIKAFFSYLSNTLRYPTEAFRNNIQGRVVVLFTVEKTGALTDITISQSAGPILDAEALRVMRKSPNWIPGQMYGRVVRVSYSEPVVFTMFR